MMDEKHKKEVEKVMKDKNHPKKAKKMMKKFRMSSDGMVKR